jgi:hypothetical protein
VTDPKRERCETLEDGRVRYTDGDTTVVLEEDDRRRLPNGKVQVRGTWVVTGPQAGSHRRAHDRERVRGRSR